MNFLADARAYAARDWSVIPIGEGKRAGVRWTPYQTRRPTEDELRTWFQCDGFQGLAVVLGPVSGGLGCRDFDTMEGFEHWAAAHRELARKLPTVATARGRHVYFRSTWTGFIHLGGDGDLRCDSKHYCLLPPSWHPSGVLYRWVVPLPDGPLPLVDPFAVGLAPATERTERTETTERAETTETTEGNCSILSALSVAQPGSTSLDDALEAAIQSTLPTATGRRNRAIFEFARALKAIPALAEAPVGALREYVRDWHELALPVIGTKPFEETWADFVVAWQRVKFPRGQEPMVLIVQRANAGPLPRVAENYDAPETRRLVAICRELQRASGENPLFLSCRTAAALVGLDQTTAWRRLLMLVADGVLVVVQKGTLHRATRYRYVGGD